MSIRFTLRLVQVGSVGDSHDHAPAEVILTRGPRRHFEGIELPTPPHARETRRDSRVCVENAQFSSLRVRMGSRLSHAPSTSDQLDDQLVTAVAAIWRIVEESEGCRDGKKEFLQAFERKFSIMAMVSLAMCEQSWPIDCVFSNHPYNESALPQSPR